MLTLSIVTPERRVAGPVPVTSVTVPGEKGEMTVLPGHARLLGTMNTGILLFEREDGRKEVAAVSAGFVEVHHDKVTILAETLELAHEIDVDRARRAQAAAEEKLRAKETFEEDMEQWQRKLQLAMIRLQAAEFLLPPH
jgi:F-type H+-transporting ATPase subunit epsilon